MLLYITLFQGTTTIYYRIYLFIAFSSIFLNYYMKPLQQLIKDLKNKIIKEVEKIGRKEDIQNFNILYSEIERMEFESAKTDQNLIQQYELLEEKVRIFIKSVNS